MRIKKKPHISRKKLLLLFLVIVTLGLVGWYAFQSTDTYIPDNNDTSVDNINYSPPTEHEIKEGQNAKKNGGTTNDGVVIESDKDTVQVGITYADIYEDRLEIRAFTNGVVDGTGTCTAIVTSGSQRIEKKSKAFIDASSSVCRPIYIPLSNLSSGTWEVTVVFSTNEKRGKSDTVTVRVP